MTRGVRSARPAQSEARKAGFSWGPSGRAARGAPLDGDLPRAGPPRGHEVLRARHEVHEGVGLGLVLSLVLVPPLPHLAAAADVRDGVHHPAVEERQAPRVEVRVDRDPVRACSSGSATRCHITRVTRTGVTRHTVSHHTCDTVASFERVTPHVLEGRHSPPPRATSDHGQGRGIACAISRAHPVPKAPRRPGYPCGGGFVNRGVPPLQPQMMTPDPSVWPFRSVWPFPSACSGCGPPPHCQFCFLAVK